MLCYVCFDGDSIGRLAGKARQADDVAGAREISNRIDAGNQIFRAWAVDSSGEVAEIGGDEGCVAVPAEKLDELPAIKEKYEKAVGATVSIGVGMKMSEASKALMAAKLQGKNRITFYTEECDKVVEEAAKNPPTEQQKIVDEYLGKAAPAMHPGAFAGAQRPSPPTVDRPVATQGDHDQDSGALEAAGDRPAPEHTTAAADFERQLHEEAWKGEEEDMAQQVQSKRNLLAVKAQVAQALQQLQAQAPMLEQLKAQAPDAYAAMVGLTQAVVGMARELAPQQPQPMQKAESLTKARSPMEVVYHVGDLETPRAPSKGPSYEGGELSVSHHPDEWREIAGLHGNTYRLSKPGAKFLSVPGGGQVHAPSIEWATANGFLKPASYHRVTYHDEDTDEDRYMDFKTPKEAAEEATEHEGARVARVSGHAFGPKGVEYWRSAHGASPVDHSSAASLAPIFYAKAHGYDGVWWNDRLDPLNLSAPRGAIFQESLPSWKRTTHEVQDETGRLKRVRKAESSDSQLARPIEHPRKCRGECPSPEYAWYSYDDAALEGRPGVRKSELVKAERLTPVELEHYSVKPGLKRVDVKHMGTGAPSQEYRQGLPDVGRAYYYRAGASPEPLVQQSAKAKYSTVLDPVKHRLYDVGLDPEGLRRPAQQRFLEGEGLETPEDTFLADVRDRGYYGYHNSLSSMPHVVALFHAHPVREVKKSETRKLTVELPYWKGAVPGAPIPTSPGYYDYSHMLPDHVHHDMELLIVPHRAAGFDTPERPSSIVRDPRAMKYLQDAHAATTDPAKKAALEAHMTDLDHIQQTGESHPGIVAQAKAARAKGVMKSEDYDEDPGFSALAKTADDPVKPFETPEELAQFLDSYPRYQAPHPKWYGNEISEEEQTRMYQANKVAREAYTSTLDQALEARAGLPKFSRHFLPGDSPYNPVFGPESTDVDGPWASIQRARQMRDPNAVTHPRWRDSTPTWNGRTTETYDYSHFMPEGWQLQLSHDGGRFVTAGIAAQVVGPARTTTRPTYRWEGNQQVPTGQEEIETTPRYAILADRAGRLRSRGNKVADIPNLPQIRDAIKAHVAQPGASHSFSSKPYLEAALKRAVEAKDEGKQREVQDHIVFADTEAAQHAAAAGKELPAGVQPTTMKVVKDEPTMEKGKLPMPETANHRNRVVLPPGTEIAQAPAGAAGTALAANKVKVQHSDGSIGTRQVTAGRILGQDPAGHAVSSREPNSR